MQSKSNKKNSKIKKIKILNTHYNYIIFEYMPKKLFPSQKPFIKKESKTKEESGAKEGEEKQELTEEQNKKLLEKETFEKMNPEQQKEVLSKRVATKKERCKYWPNCNDPTCIFSHPTETVS